MFETPVTRCRSRALALAMLVLALGSGAIAWADSPDSSLQVYAYTLKHQPTRDALALIRPLLSPRGTVEEQPGNNAVVIRDTRAIMVRVMPVLQAFDHPPEKLRFDIKIIQAGPRPKGVSPPRPELPIVESRQLPPDQVERLRNLLRFDDYRVLAQAGVSSNEGEEVTYSLGQTYSVSFRSGTVMAGQRLKLEGFKVLKHLANPTNKGRQLKPRELFHATLNLWLGRPFNLVLAMNDSRTEALMVAISCRREGDEP